MKQVLIFYSIFILCFDVFAMGEDDPLIAKVMFDQLEIRDTDGHNPRVWDAAAYLGKDLQKIWLKSEGERADSKTENHEIRLLYSHALSAYWDGMLGWRYDDRPEPERSWLEIGLQGTAPYFLETSASLFVGESGRSGLRLELEKEVMLTQRWVLAPEIEINFHGHNDEDVSVGSGLSNVEAGIRLAYEISRQFAPYIGINWEKYYGQSADFAQEEGEDVSDTQFVMGIRAWF